MSETAAINVGSRWRSRVVHSALSPSRDQIHAVFTLTRHDNCPDMSHASYQVINATTSHSVLRSQRYGIPRLLQQERVIKTITRILSALNAKSTIVAFATACRALERPVLDALWESQDDWFQLLRCFPPDVWEERDNAFVSCRPLATTRHSTHVYITPQSDFRTSSAIRSQRNGFVSGDTRRGWSASTSCCRRSRYQSPPSKS